MDIPAIEKCVKEIILKKIDDQCSSLCSKKHPSFLRTPRSQHKDLAKSFSWVNILEEMKERAPDILDVLTTIAVPNVNTNGEQVPRVCTAYAVLLNSRNRELSKVQKMSSILLGAGHATEMVCITCYFVKKFQKNHLEN